MLLHSETISFIHTSIIRHSVPLRVLHSMETQPQTQLIASQLIGIEQIAKGAHDRSTGVALDERLYDLVPIHSRSRSTSKDLPKRALLSSSTRG